MPTETTLPELDEQTPTASDAAAEAQFANEIVELWQARASAHGSLRKNQQDLKLIRANLAEKLHGLKSVLSRRGCLGGWSPFLKEQRIPRATADRLVTAHEKSLTPAPGICLIEHIQEPNEAIRGYVTGIWPKLSKMLKTREAVEMFVAEVRQKADESFGAQAAAPGLINELSSVAVAPTIEHACAV